MTLVNIDLRKPTASGADAPFLSGQVSCTPTARRVVDAHVVLPAPFSVALVDGQAVVDLAPTADGSWAWRITEGDMTGGATRVVAVPSVGPVAYGDLVNVDPKTLLPTAEPAAAWWAEIAEQAQGFEVVGDDLIVTRRNGDVVNAGPVRGPAGVADDASMSAIAADGQSAFSQVVTAKIATAAPLVNQQVADAYPARPDAPVVLWLGALDPDAWMEDGDIWVNPAADPPPTFANIGTEASNPASALAAGIRDGYGSAQVIYIPARALNPMTAASMPTLVESSSVGGAGVPAYSMPQAVYSGVCGAIPIPAGWNTAKISAIFTHNAATLASTLRVRWRINANMLTNGGLVSAGTVNADGNTPPPDVADKVATYAPPASSFAVTPGGLLRVAVARLGDNAADTVTADPIFLLALKLEKLT